MAEALPEALRRRVVEAYERGEGSYRCIAKRFGVGEATVKRWVRQYRRDGTCAPEKKGGGNPSNICLKELEGIVTKLGDANAGEIAAAYNRKRRGRNRRHVSSIKRALYRAGYVVKKSASGRWNSSAQTSSKSEKSFGA
jgi:transposase